MVWLPGWLSGKESTCQCRRCGRGGVNPCVGKIPWRRKRLPTPVFLHGESHGQRSPVGYSPWGRKEWDMTEHAVFCTSSLLVSTKNKYIPFPFRRWKWNPVVSDSLWPHGLYSPWNSPGQNTGVGTLSLLQGYLPNPGIEHRSPTLQVDSLPAEPQGKSSF